MRRKLTLAQACAMYPNRYTLDHVPDWARVQRVLPKGEAELHYYAPQYASDAEWYARAIFPGEPGLHGNCKHMITGVPTWPLGQSLKQQPGTAIALHRRKLAKIYA